MSKDIKKSSPKKVDIKEKEKAELENLKQQKKSEKVFIKKIFTAFLIAVLGLSVIDAANGIISIGRVTSGGEPFWYFTSDIKKENDKETTTYTLILYNIVIVETPTDTKITLKPFFMK